MLSVAAPNGAPLVDEKFERILAIIAGAMGVNDPGLRAPILTLRFGGSLMKIVLPNIEDAALVERVQQACEQKFTYPRISVVAFKIADNVSDEMVDRELAKRGQHETIHSMVLSDCGRQVVVEVASKAPVNSEDAFRKAEIAPKLRRQHKLSRQPATTEQPFSAQPSKPRGFLHSLNASVRPVVENVRGFIAPTRIYSLGSCLPGCGAMYLLQFRGKNILLDAGPKQDGGSYNKKLDLNQIRAHVGIEKIDAVFLSHAHCDHYGGLAHLYRSGCNAPLFMSDLTRQIIAPHLESGRTLVKAHTQIAEAGDEKCCGPLRLHFFAEAHMPGALGIQISDGSRHIRYSGDVGFGPSAFLKSTDQELSLPRPDVLLLDSTNGNKQTVSPIFNERILQQSISRSIRAGGCVVIPALSRGKAQELLTLTHGALAKEGLLETQLIVGREAVRVGHIARTSPDDARSVISPEGREALQWMKQCAKNRSLAMRPKVPSIIITSQEDAVSCLDWMSGVEGSDSLVLAGHLFENTVWRTIAETGAFDHESAGRKQFQVLRLRQSGHADDMGLLGYCRVNAKPETKIVLVHGDPEAQTGLQELLRQQQFPHTHVSFSGSNLLHYESSKLMRTLKRSAA